ncbi:MAG: UvrD-helicase domain-containing protein [Bacteroidales bacterium]|nr:UvrD-helicase domain-containing protein [Bacteroidales bacterium]
MNILYYRGLDYRKVKKQFEKTVEFLKAGDFSSAEVKKMASNGYYRAKLDYENRLLFKFAWYNDQYYLLLLEVIYNHEYDKSRFLRGAKIYENKLDLLRSTDEVGEQNREELVYANPRSVHFHILDKVISFDQEQERLFRLKPPVIIIGSAGSGKTALTLEKLKTLKGDVLYVTLSPFLVENSSSLYYANHYENDRQEIDFLSYKEFLETLRIIKGRELDFQAFEQWLQPRSQSFGIKDAYKLFEEFRGVLTGKDITSECLSPEEYQGLGVRQSIFLSDERKKVYAAFRKYLAYLGENEMVDLNMVSYRWLEYCKPRYDFIVIDEVQDFTNIQLYILLKSLKNEDNFILCGDSNQNVHPNFFSWTNVKSMFYTQALTGNEIQFLRSNYRNSPGITDIANKLLKIKNARFGSIDRESTYLVESVADTGGEVQLLTDSTRIREQLNTSTMRSTQYAVLVMRPEDKAGAKRIFKTPLVFSVQEAKGLEYRNIIILNFVSGNSKEFREITMGVSAEQIRDDTLVYSRGKDKSDKSPEAYKIFINSLYVAITRAIKNLYILEDSEKHEILGLLGLAKIRDKVSMKEEVSSMDEWKEEARKLEMQGKKEQAEEIRKSILEVHEPEWEPLTPARIEELKKEALDPDLFNKKAKDLLFHYSLIYGDYECMDRLSELKYRKADRYETECKLVRRKYYAHYENDNVNAVEKSIREYGVDFRDRFNRTPLHSAVDLGSKKILDLLIQYGANPSLTDNLGKIPLQIALYQSYDSQDHFQTLNPLLNDLVTDHIKIKVDDRMIKIDNHKIEYILLHLFIALQKDVIDECGFHFLTKRGVRAGDIERIVKEYPDIFFQAFRKKRSYLSSNLSKHEIRSENPYNKKLFKRLYRGYYEINPDLAVWANDQWMNVYDMMQSEEVKVPTREEIEEFFKEYQRKLKEENRRLRERNGWYDEYDDEYDDEFNDAADPAGDGYDREEELPGEPEVDAQKRTIREADTQFRLPFDDI